jgi:hypothetical protein
MVKWFLLGLIVLLILPVIFSIGGDVVCSSSDPAMLNIKASQVKTKGVLTEEDIGIIISTNLTGGEISNITCTGSGAFGQVLDESDGCTSSLANRAEFNLEPNASLNSGIYDRSYIEITYVDSENSSKSATITCSGPISVYADEEDLRKMSSERGLIGLLLFLGPFVLAFLGGLLAIGGELGKQETMTSVGLLVFAVSFLAFVFLNLYIGFELLLAIVTTPILLFIGFGIFLYACLKKKNKIRILGIIIMVVNLAYILSGHSLLFSPLNAPAFLNGYLAGVAFAIAFIVGLIALAVYHLAKLLLKLKQKTKPPSKPLKPTKP